MGSTSFLDTVKVIAYSHHEKWGGCGYPLGFKADVYDALISKRIYKPAFGHEKAHEIIYEQRGKHFDPHVVDAFVKLVARPHHADPAFWGIMGVVFGPFAMPFIFLSKSRK